MGVRHPGALEAELGKPVVYSNDGNAAAMYAHYTHFGPVAIDRSSVSAIVGTGLGGRVIHDGRIVVGAAGMGGELGHVHIPATGIVKPDAYFVGGGVVETSPWFRTWFLDTAGARGAALAALRTLG